MVGCVVFVDYDDLDGDNWLVGAEPFPVMVYASTPDSLSTWFDITLVDCPAVFFRVVYFHRRCFAKFARCHLPRVLSQDLQTKTCLNSTWFLSNFHGQLLLR